MQRLTDYWYCRLVEAGFERLPPKIAQTLKHVDFWCGESPIRAGVMKDIVTKDNRSYESTACYMDSWRTLDKRPTINLFRDDEPWVVVHELGHALDELLGHRFVPQRAVMDYDETWPWERFACHFSEWVYRHNNGLYTNGDEFRRLVMADDKMVPLYERLARGEPA